MEANHEADTRNVNQPDHEGNRKHDEIANKVLTAEERTKRNR